MILYLRQYMYIILTLGQLKYLTASFCGIKLDRVNWDMIKGENKERGEVGG